LIIKDNTGATNPNHTGELTSSVLHSLNLNLGLHGIIA
jgi:pyruvate/oxaloacetate carboxyltransferase